MPGRFTTLIETFDGMPDPRIERTRAHNLTDILVMSICAIICGADGWDDIASFCRCKEDWLKTMLDLPNGIPCADTFRRVISRLDVAVFEERFRNWAKSLHEITQNEVIALDGKVLRHSFDSISGQTPIQMVSAWASKARLVLGQVKVSEKSNEIPAVPELLKLLEIAGCIVTTDAMSCQKATAAQIISQQANYILAVKDNQPTLFEAIKMRFEYIDEHPFEREGYSSKEDYDKGHGRIESRRCDVISLAENDPYWGDFQKNWSGLRSLVRITSIRQNRKGATEEDRYFISSIPKGPLKILNAVRQHWGIENSLHYVLDVSLDEDACRIRKDGGAEMFSVMRHMALNLLQQEKTCGRGIKAKRKLAGWDNSYLMKILASGI